jgi:hypothetical protein
MRVIQPALERLTQLLRVESILTNNNNNNENNNNNIGARTEAQQLASRLHFPMQQLYAII